MRKFEQLSDEELDILEIFLCLPWESTRNRIRRSLLKDIDDEYIFRRAGEKAFNHLASKRTNPDTWTYDFEEMGGYDCMTDAFLIKLNGCTRAKMDLRLYGQETSWEPREDDHNPKKEAEEYARLIVDALNAQSRKK
jgi:hypothetical protein